MQTPKEQDWERTQQASLLADVAQAFKSDVGMSDGEGDRVTLFSLATQLSPSGQADAKTLTTRVASGAAGRHQRRDLVGDRELRSPETRFL